MAFLIEGFILCCASIYLQFACIKKSLLERLLEMKKSIIIKMESKEIESQIKSARKTKLLLYVVLAVLVAVMLFVFVI